MKSKLTELIKEQPGFTFALLSPARIASDGLRGYELVLHEDGKQVMEGNMLVGRKPRSFCKPVDKPAAKPSKEKLKSTDKPADKPKGHA